MISPANTDEGPVIQEPPASDTKQQPSSTQPGSSEPNEEAGTPSGYPQAGEPSGQSDQSSEAQQESTEPANNQNTPPQTETNGATPSTQDDGPVVLTISGDGVNGETTWTLNQLQSLRDGYRELTYSTTNNWPSFGSMEARGISLPYLLRQAGIKDTAASIKLTSTDGYYTTLPYNQVFGVLYSYSSHSASGSSGASAIEPVVAWVWGDTGRVREENIRPFFGQTGPWEVNTASFVKDLSKIEVLTSSPGSWAVPSASIADGATVSAGTELELSHGSMDSIRIYYTLDGSEPDYFSPVYNPSTSYFQPQLIRPVLLTESATIKAFAAGLGKERSAVVTFAITVE